MILKNFAIFAVFAAALILSGCTAKEVGTMQGAALGTVAGATGGAAFGQGEKAIYGAAAGGAVAGGLIGYLRSKGKTRYCHYFDEDGFPYDAPCGKP